MGKTKEMRMRKRPDLDGLLAHPIRKSDNGPAPSGSKSDASSDDAGSSASYEDWLLDHRGTPRFYLFGFAKVRSVIRQTDAKYFHSFANEAIAIAKDEKWQKDLNAFERPASYNQFRNAIILERPMFFEHAAQVLLACECALANCIDRGEYAGNRMDVYDMMKIVPACYNIDGFNTDSLRLLRKDIANFDVTMLSQAGQKSRTLLDKLADGHCVTRKTARALHWKIVQLQEPYRGEDVEIGDVRGRPGKKRLGHKSATTAELVDVDDFTAYLY